MEQPPGSRAAARPGSRRRAERNMEVCEGLIDILAALFNVSSKEMRRPGRSSMTVARVRQVAMYVAHVVFQLPMGEIARCFARERTTVLYAIHLVEDMRDDLDFDAVIAMVESVAQAALAGGRRA
jgi:chromosomal replication initiation ATPase DnaA